MYKQYIPQNRHEANNLQNKFLKVQIQPYLVWHIIILIMQRQQMFESRSAIIILYSRSRHSWKLAQRGRCVYCILVECRECVNRVIGIGEVWTMFVEDKHQTIKQQTRVTKLAARRCHRHSLTTQYCTVKLHHSIIADHPTSHTDTHQYMIMNQTHSLPLPNIILVILCLF